jgi:hypothetical protein
VKTRFLKICFVQIQHRKPGFQNLPFFEFVNVLWRLRRGLEMWRRALAAEGGQATEAGVDAREEALSWVVRAADTGAGTAWRFLGDVVGLCTS